MYVLIATITLHHSGNEKSIVIVNSYPAWPLTVFIFTDPEEDDGQGRQATGHYLGWVFYLYTCEGMNEWMNKQKDRRMDEWRMTKINNELIHLWSLQVIVMGAQPVNRLVSFIWSFTEITLKQGRKHLAQHLEWFIRCQVMVQEDSWEVFFAFLYYMYWVRCKM